MRTTLLLLCLLGLAGCGSQSHLSTAAVAQPLPSPSLPPGLEDVSPHQVTFVEVEPGVRLEVLDWGGSGEALVLLTGLGDNAHVYDDFANQFTEDFRVIGITRRGFGRSSQPESGYDVPTRALDDLRVLDALGIDKAIFVGHSMAGDELSQLGAEHPERVEKLVYLDAYDYGEHSKLPQPPAPDYSDFDVQSVANFTAANVRFYGTRSPRSSLPGVYRFDASGAVVAPVTDPAIGKKIVESSQPANFGKIQAPALAIFAPFSTTEPQLFYHYLPEEQKVEYHRVFPALITWQNDAISRFRTGVRNSRVVELPGAPHYLYLSNEGQIVWEMRKFLLP